jgi:hypothetical protein
MIHENPFTYGNPISDSSRFVGRQREIDQVLSRMANREFESSSVVGERRIGKTSLFNQLSDPDVRARHGLAGDEYLFVYLDLQMVGEAMSPVRLWRRLLDLVAKECHDEPLSAAVGAVAASEPVDTFALDEFFGTVDAKNHHIVFLLDEFEHVTQNANFGADFFYSLRSLAIHHQLALVTSSRVELIELTHSEAIRSSPFFNIFANIVMPLFDRAEASELIDRALDPTSIRFTRPELALIEDLAGQHPFFLQVAGSCLFETYGQALEPPARADALRASFRQEAGPHLEHYWRSSDDQEKIALTAIALLERQAEVGGRHFRSDQLQRVTTGSPPTIDRLRRRGLVVASGATLGLFSSALGDWVLAELTAALSDQQSYADWVAANRPTMERVSQRARAALNDVLPRVASRYRDLIVTWASDPKTWVAVVGLLKGFFGVG